MLSKFLNAKKNGSPKPVQDQPPQPADFDLGSDKSRAAVRALLETKKNSKRDVFRWFVISVAGPRPGSVPESPLEGSSVEGSPLEGCDRPPGAVCSRVLYDDATWGSGILEMIDLLESDMSQKDAERLAARVPVDGKGYKLEESRNRNARPRPIRETK